MNKPIHPLALFRLSVLGPLASREQLARGELKNIITELASKTYSIPGSKRVHLSPQVIEKWYYDWLKGGIDALEPKVRCDKNQTQLSDTVQKALMAIKKDNPARSINTVIYLLERQGVVAKGELSRSTVHRFLKHHQLSKRTMADAPTIERRAFVACHAGDIWHGDVLHGPCIVTQGGFRKTYLVSFLDDASRLITHSAFCLSETALDVEGVLKQAILKRGIPKKIIIDNGAAYRAHSLQSICARLEIRLIYCRPYEPEGKGKLERYHRTFRELFLDEINIKAIQSLEDFNARLWAWVEHVYHQRPHLGLQGKTPLTRWREDLIHIRPLGIKAHHLDDIFYHRVSRRIHKDGTLSFEGQWFEVPYEYVGQTVILVVDPHAKKPIRIEAKSGENLGAVTPLDEKANTHRRRQRPETIPATRQRPSFDAVEEAYQDYSHLFDMGNTDEENH
jgi:transposase InsO family protein